MPTLLEWLNEGVQIALESQEDEGEVNVGAAAAARAAEFYEGSARALRRLQPAEAEAGGLDVGNVSANYMLQAAVGYASGEKMLLAAQALVQVKLSLNSLLESPIAKLDTLRSFEELLPHASETSVCFAGCSE